MLIFKVLVLGDSGVGKTSLMDNYLGKLFSDHEPPTIGVEFGSKEIEIGGGESDDKCKIHIWNTSGQERFRSIVKSYYRNVRGVIFVCDLTRKDSYNHLKYWIKDFKNQNDKDDVCGIIVGTKTDLLDSRVVSDEDLEEIAKEMDMNYFTVSCKKDYKKICNLFKTLADEMIQNHVPDEIEFETIKVNDRSSSCCLLL